MNRKRIALLMNTISEFTLEEREKIFDYTKGYCNNLAICENERFIISSDSELKQLLFGISERYYTTPVGNEKRIANSIIKIA